MGSRRETASKTSANTLVILFVLFAVFFACLFFYSIGLYSKYHDADYGDFLYEELTFERYERIEQVRYGSVYIIYFKEYDEPFRIDRISNRSLDKVMLDGLAKGESVKVYFEEQANRFSNYKICEISCDAGMLLSFSDYKKENQSNQIMGMVLYPVMILISLFLVWMFSDTFKPVDCDTDLGKIRIEYIINGNVVRVYNSKWMCSLVINDKVFDQYHGFCGSYFSLKGRIKSGAKHIRIEARMGAAFMCLYCNGELVAKKFMALG